ncbi:transporter substrate-binding domain-containing protein [Budviciaceae bacterium BWR-B9]|uniref:Transporter substrate-binding domain-containing protein n=1 Tax=Limnobaculum allomyrinae TaxID=2791986 RepID=A0ABS1IVU4_9GAMM|nr:MULTISPECIES: transporter substrate-binding domain-containing protein [Limnobaculum]MBK5145881.1 transporter substrate-binding domain-containing protein [Limnobaculum allomyrinae]MBV7693892.1 transporter substrate-binding domain-containing protein [Limnobaculum sp. M2-1]
MKFKLLVGTALILSCLQVQARTMDAIQQSGTLKVGVPGDYAPLAYRNASGALEGYDIDMANALGKSLNLKVDFVITSWPTLSDDLAADKFDVAMGGVTETAKRKAEFGLTKPIVANGKIALASCSVAKELPDLEKIDQPKVKVVVNPGGTNQTFVDSHIKKAQIIRVKDNFDNLQALRDKTADIMVTDLIEGDYYQNKEPNVLCMATEKPFSGTESHKVYMVKKDNTKLLESINTWLQGETKSQLAKQWKIRE